MTIAITMVRKKLITEEVSNMKYYYSLAFVVTVVAAGHCFRSGHGRGMGIGYRHTNDGRHCNARAVSKFAKVQ
jgi:hypothetical protein